MPATTLYHPVSIYVIRGAAQYCGFNFGKLAQLKADQEKQMATYRVEIVGFPEGYDHMTQEQQMKQLQSCFMDDIQVTWTGRNTTGKLMANIYVGLRGL